IDAVISHARALRVGSAGSGLPGRLGGCAAAVSRSAPRLHLNSRERCRGGTATSSRNTSEQVLTAGARGEIAMCFFVTVGLAANRAEALANAMPRGLMLLPSANPSIQRHLPPTYATFVLISGHCSCGLYFRPIVGESEAEVETKI